MEPVSLLIGIVPLCAQLAKTTTTINNLISSYKSAARELEALSNTLADVTNVCESLGDILYATDTSEYHPSEERLFAALHGRIQECHDRLSDIQHIIQIVNGKRSGPFRSEGFLFLQFKDKISSCTKRLDTSLSSLNLVLTTSNFIRLLQPPRMEVTFFEEANSRSQSSAVVAPGRTSSCGYIDTSPLSTNVSRKSIPETTCVRNRWHQSLMGLAFIAKTTMQKKTANIYGLGPSVEDCSTFTIGSPFSSRSIKISVKQDFLSPLYITLQVPCVIPVYHGSSSLGDRIRNAYTNDDPQEIRQLLEQRSVTTTTLLGWYDHYDTGYTILGVSIWYELDLPFIDIKSVSSSINSATNSSICEVTNDHGGGKVRLTRKWEKLRIISADSHRTHFPERSGVFKFMFETSDLQCAVDYINMRKDGMGPDELESVLTGVLTCSQLKSCIDAYLTWSQPARGCFYKVLGRRVLESFSKQHLLEHDVEDWASFISEHTARGLDIYSDLHTDLHCDASTLTAILRHPACPDVAVSNLHLWLDVLELAGVEIAQYLEIETPRCFATWGASAAWHMPGYREEGSLINRVLQVQYSRGRFIPYWRQEVDRACSIRELLMEFPRFLHRETIDTHVNSTDTMRLRQAWKAGRTTTFVYPEKTTWPVAPRMEDDSRPPDLRHLTGMNTEVKRAIEWVYREYLQRNRRHERKLEGKMRKGAGKRKVNGEKSMPGSWVD